MTTAQEFLASVKARSAAATPGPWTYDNGGDWPSNAIKAGKDAVIDGAGCGCCGSGLYAENDADPGFAAAARTDVDRLVAMVEAARKALAYCSIEPGYLHPQNNVQHAAAAAALVELDRIAAGEVGE